MHLDSLQLIDLRSKKSAPILESEPALDPVVQGNSKLMDLKGTLSWPLTPWSKYDVHLSKISHDITYLEEQGQGH